MFPNICLRETALRSPSCHDRSYKRRKDITRIQNSLTGLWVFDIMLAISDSHSVDCIGYRIWNALGCVGRRTHIFVNNVDPFILNGVDITKDQYCYRCRRFNEADVLFHVHAEEEIPGVVHMAH